MGSFTLDILLKADTLLHVRSPRTASVMSRRLQPTLGVAAAVACLLTFATGAAAHPTAGAAKAPKRAHELVPRHRPLAAFRS